MEVKKITDHQLKKVTDQQKRLNDVLTNIGVLEVQKHNLAQQVKNISEEIEKTKSELEEEYGKVNINLADGTYEEIKEEEKDA
jgi:flagellar biosynthesis chaperone FliJ|tara:strand:+ start:241 stop:489 length:249 start_codon:yes stop_codon:yes gene_type:complete